MMRGEKHIQEGASLAPTAPRLLLTTALGVPLVSLRSSVCVVRRKGFVANKKYRARIVRVCVLLS